MTHSRKNRRCPRKNAEQSPQKRHSKSLPHPQQEERIHRSAATEKTPHANNVKILTRTPPHVNPPRNQLRHIDRYQT